MVGSGLDGSMKIGLRRGWELWEEQLVRDLYPDYPAILRVLPHRTYWAVRSRARKLGVVTSREIWKASTVRSIEELSRTHTTSEIASKIADMETHQVDAIIKYFGFGRKPREGFRRAGIPVIDDVLYRADQQGLTLVEVDRRAGIGKRYFAGRRWENGLHGGHLARAVFALGGELYVEWEDD